MHDCSVATGDAWLHGFLPPLLRSPQMRGGVVFLVFFVRLFVSAFYRVFHIGFYAGASLGSAAEMAYVKQRAAGDGSRHGGGAEQEIIGRKQ